MESLIAEHGPELVLENLISEYGATEVFGAIMEEYVQEFGEDLVNEKFGETLVEQYGEEVIAKNMFESIIGDFHEQEFSDEDFAVLSENSNAFITEMQTLSEEEFDNYIENLTEEEIVTAIQLSSLNEEYLVEFLKKIGKALKKGVKAVGKVAGKVLKNPILSTVASFALPGVGSLAAGLGSKLASTAVGKAVGAVGSKIAGSALGKGVAALGKTAIGGALKGAAGQAIKGGIGSKLTGGSFSQGAKAGAVGSLVGNAAGAIGSKLGLDKVMTSGIGSQIKGVAGDALTSGIGSKLTGGSFSQGAKAGAIGSVIGSVAKGFGDKISQTTGSQAAGDVASNVASGVADKIANKPKSVAAPADDAGEAEAPEQTAVQDNDQEEKVVARPSVPPKATTMATKAPQPQQDNEEDEADTVGGFMRGIRKARQQQRMAAEQTELLQHLSSLNEEQLEQFVDQLSDEDAALVAEALEEAINPNDFSAQRDYILGTKAPSVGPTKANAAKLQQQKKTTAKTAAQKKKDDEKKYKDDVKAALAINQRKQLSSILGPAPSVLDRKPPPGMGPTVERDIELRKEKLLTPAQKKARDVMDVYKRQTSNYILTGDYNKPPKIDLSDTEKSRRENPDAWKTQGGFGPQDRGDKPATSPATGSKPKPGPAAGPKVTPAPGPKPAPGPRPGPSPAAGDNDWDYLSTWAANPIARGSRGGADDSMGGSSDGYESSDSGYEPSDSGYSPSDDSMDRIQPAKKEKDLGNVTYDWLKRSGRAGIRQGIGGAILGQDWQQSAKAGAAGRAAVDLGKGILDVIRGKYSPNQKGMNESIEESNMNGEETTMETTELTEEQIREERMLAIKEAVKQFKGNMREDVDALFNGESLSEEFRAKATLIFESAVTSRVESILEEIVQQNDEVLANAYEEIKGQLTEQVDEYLNYVVEQWMEENQVAIETGLRAELAEDFISGLRSLFQEHYIEIPEEKVDVAETLAAELDQAAEYVETVHQHVAEQDETIASLQEQLNLVKKEKAINAFCEGLTAVQAGKMKALAEGVEFTTEGDFEEKLAVLRENYFPTKVQVKSEVKELQQVALNEEPEVASTNNIMNRYVQAIAKTAPKA